MEQKRDWESIVLFFGVLLAALITTVIGVYF